MFPDYGDVVVVGAGNAAMCAALAAREHGATVTVLEYEGVEDLRALMPDPANEDAAGQLVGGLLYFNYPGGTGRMSGAVFGRIAGNSAGRAAAA